MLADSAVAQDPASSVKKVGVLWSGTVEGQAPYLGAFLQGMREFGWIDGKTAHFIMRFDEDKKSRLPVLAAELVALGVDVLAVQSAGTAAARSATTTIPIVTLDAYDPVAEGLTANLARPDGNVTGLSWQSVETAVKRVELARELLPRLQRVALLFDPGDLGPAIEAKGVLGAAARVGLEIRAFEVRRLGDFPAAFAAIKRYQPQALLLHAGSLMGENLDETVRFASSIRLPTLCEVTEFAEAGVLLAYGPNAIEAFKLSARQVDRILKGAKPADLPFEQPTKFELVVNIKTAKALDLVVPESIMLRATRVIR